MRSPTSLQGALLLLGMAALCAGEGGGTPVTVVTDDSSSTFYGTTPVTKIQVKTDKGVVDVPVSKVGSIRRSGDRLCVLVTAGKNVEKPIQGEILLDRWTVLTRQGRVDLSLRHVESIDFGGKRSAEGPEKPPSPPRSWKTVDIAETGARRLEESLCVKSLVLANDRKTLFALCITPGQPDLQARILAIPSGTLDVRKEIPLPFGGFVMAPTPSGKTLVVTGERMVNLVDAVAEKVDRSFPLKPTLSNEVIPVTEEMFCSSDPMEGFLVVSIKDLLLVKIVRMTSGCSRLMPDGRHLVACTGVIDVPDGNPLKIEDKIRPHPAGNMSGFTLSPDGCFAVDTDGTLYRIGQDPLALNACAKLGPCECSLFLPKSSRVLLFTKEGSVNDYDLSTFALRKTTSLGMVARAAVADEEKKILYVFGPETVSAGSACTSPGKIYRFTIPE